MEDENREDNLIENSPSLNRQETIHNQLSKLQKQCNMDNIKKLYKYMQSRQQFSFPAKIFKRASLAKARYSDIYKIKPREQQLLPIFRKEQKPQTQIAPDNKCKSKEKSEFNMHR